MKVDKVSLIMNRNIDLLLYQKLRTLKYKGLGKLLNYKREGVSIRFSYPRNT